MIDEQSKAIQKSTKPNKKHYLVDDLKPEHQEAVYLRIEGADYRYIAMRLKYSYTYVRELFSDTRGGLCKPAYDELMTEIIAENKERFIKLQETMEEAAPEAFNNLRRFARKNWKAAESLLHIAGFTPLQKIKAEIENKDLDKVAGIVTDLSSYAKSEVNGSDQDAA